MIDSTMLKNQSLFIFFTVGLIACLSMTAVAAPQATKNPRVPATVRAYASAEIFAKVGGYLKTVHVDIGDTIESGQVLAVIDAPEMDRRLEQKQKLLDLAKAEVDQALAHVTEIKASLEALEAMVEEAETMKSQKRSLFNYEKKESDRIASLAASGAVRSELMDSSRLKVQAAEADMLSAQARVATAVAHLAGGKAAVQRAQADTIAANAKADVATADVKYAQQMNSYLMIKAPWAGKVTNRMYDAGAFVQSADGNSAAQPILRMVRDDKVRVAFSLSQKDIRGLKPGISVSLSEIDALPDQTFEGTVSRFSAELDSKTRMLQVEMDLDNADGKLRAGYFGYATVHFDKK